MEEKLTLEFENAWTKLAEGENTQVFKVADDFKTFMDAAKTEREAVNVVEAKAVANGYKLVDDVIKSGAKLEAGMKLYSINRDKNIVLFVIGSKPLEEGMNIVGAHLDVPRLDLKPNPLYESDDIAFLKTHYYGGVKKYQWTTIPLALHGVVYTKTGEKVNVVVGENDNDPVFFITDLLPHLGKDQAKKSLAEAVTGEDLNLVVGGIPTEDEDAKEKVKYAVLQLLNEKYGMTEEDFTSAEIEVVPATKARYVGFDKAFIAAHGHDDRACSYGAYQSLFDLEETPEKTAVALLVDKEEVGSMGNTGMQSRYFENVVAELLALESTELVDLRVRRCFSSSTMLSADVSAAFDPHFASVSEKRNSAYAGKGVVLTKYTGARGKSGCNDANAEFVAKVRNRFNETGVVWQNGELGKIDQGGGGTIAYILANLDVEVVDCGMAVLAMHAPYELISTIDLYETYKAYKSFYTID